MVNFTVWLRAALKLFEMVSRVMGFGWNVVKRKCFAF